MEIISCNRKQADKLLNKLFKNFFIITKINKMYDENLYFITVRHGINTVSEWQYRGFACFGEIYKSNKRFDIYEHSEHVLDEFNKACEKAIKSYDNGSMNSIFIYLSNKVIFSIVFLIALIISILCI